MQNTSKNTRLHSRVLQQALDNRLFFAQALVSSLVWMGRKRILSKEGYAELSEPSSPDPPGSPVTDVVIAPKKLGDKTRSLQAKKQSRRWAASRAVWQEWEAEQYSD